MKVSNDRGNALMQQIMAQKNSGAANADKKLKNARTDGDGDSDGSKALSAKSSQPQGVNYAKLEAKVASGLTDVKNPQQQKSQASPIAGYGNNAKAEAQQTASNKGEIVNLTA